MDTTVAMTVREQAAVMLRGYAGRSEFLLSLAGQYARYGRLSDRQWACAEREVERQAAPVTVAAPSAPVAEMPNGTYTVVFPSGEYRTLRIKPVWENYVGPATQVAQFLSGPDNTTSFTSFAFLMNGAGRVWGRYATDGLLAEALAVLTDADGARRAEMGHAYALRSGRCYRCGRTLTVPASIHRGLGPDCAGMVGYAPTIDAAIEMEMEAAEHLQGASYGPAGAGMGWFSSQELAAEASGHYDEPVDWDVADDDGDS